MGYSVYEYGGNYYCSPLADTNISLPVFEDLEYAKSVARAIAEETQNVVYVVPLYNQRYIAVSLALYWMFFKTIPGKTAVWTAHCGVHHVS